jgi:hypothetical protein
MEEETPLEADVDGNLFEPEEAAVAVLLRDVRCWETRISAVTNYHST